jgi:hypothetical protein
LRNKPSHGTTKKGSGMNEQGNTKEKRSLKVDQKEAKIVGLLVAG